MAGQPERVVVRHQGQPDDLFLHNSRAKDVLLALTTTKAGALQDTISGVQFGGAALVPAGVYRLKLPAELFDPREMIQELRLYRPHEVAAPMEPLCRATQPKAGS